MGEIGDVWGLYNTGKVTDWSRIDLNSRKKLSGGKKRNIFRKIAGTPIFLNLPPGFPSRRLTVELTCGAALSRLLSAKSYSAASERLNRADVAPSGAVRC